MLGLWPGTEYCVLVVWRDGPENDQLWHADPTHRAFLRAFGLPQRYLYLNETSTRSTEKRILADCDGFCGDTLTAEWDLRNV